MRQFNNPNQLPSLIAAMRVRELDPAAEVTTYHTSTFDGQPLDPVYSINVESTLDQETLEALFTNPLTAAEVTLIESFISAVPNFNALPNWADWTAQQAETYISSNILQGWNQSQVDAWIDSTVTSLAGARTALKQIGASLIATRTILINIAKAILFLRDYLIKLRR